MAKAKKGRRFKDVKKTSTDNISKIKSNDSNMKQHRNPIVNSEKSSPHGLLLEKSNEKIIPNTKMKALTIGNKLKQKIAVREAARMKLVQDHPEFKSNILASMKSHLEFIVSKK